MANSGGVQCQVFVLYIWPVFRDLSSPQGGEGIDISNDVGGCQGQSFPKVEETGSRAPFFGVHRRTLRPFSSAFTIETRTKLQPQTVTASLQAHPHRMRQLLIEVPHLVVGVAETTFPATTAPCRVWPLVDSRLICSVGFAPTHRMSTAGRPPISAVSFVR